MKDKIVYKIRRISDGLFSAGGMTPKFTKQGKLWVSKSALMNHLNLTSEKAYKGCELVTLRLVQVEDDVTSMEDVLSRAQALREEREAQAEKRWQEFTRQRELSQLATLMEKYGSV